MSEKKLVRRAVATALLITCIVLAVTLVGVFAYYIPMINDDNNTISSLGTQISQLEFNVGNLQEKLNNTLYWNWSISFQDTIMSNPSAWVNRTVIVEGVLDELLFPLSVFPFEFPPYHYGLRSGNQTIGVAIPNSVNMSAFWNMLNFSGCVRIYGVVVKGEIGFTPGWSLPRVTYYIAAEIVVPL